MVRKGEWVVAMLCAVAGGCQSEPVDPARAPIGSGPDLCNMSGNGRLVLGPAFAFDTELGAVDLTTDSGQLVATGATAVCGRDVAGYTAQLRGTGTWDGAPDHRFVLHATHVTAAAATPAPGVVLDTVSVSVTSASGETVYAEAGFASAPHSVTRVALPEPPCTVSGSGRLPDGERLTVSVSQTPTTPIEGTLSFVGPPGAGARPVRIEATLDWLVCRRDGAMLADAGGLGTVDGLAGYYVRVHVQDHGGVLEDYVRIRAWDNHSGASQVYEGYAPPSSFSVVAP